MLRPIFYRSSNNYDRDKVSRETGTDFIDPETGEPYPSMTQQSFKEDSDINVLVRRFGVVRLAEMGTIPHVTNADFTDSVTDFHSAMLAMRQAQESFMMLPAEVRDRFRNDPHRYVEFCSDPKNAREMVEMGIAILRPEEDTKPQLVKVVKESDDGVRVSRKGSKAREAAESEPGGDDSE